MPSKVQHLAREALSDAVTITVGKPGSANLDVRQSVLVMASNEQKLQWLGAKMQGFIDEGDVLMFANQKKSVDELVPYLKVLTSCVHIILSRIHPYFSRHTTTEYQLHSQPLVCAPVVFASPL